MNKHLSHLEIEFMTSVSILSSASSLSDAHGDYCENDSIYVHVLNTIRLNTGKNP